MADISIGFTAWAMEHPSSGAVPRWTDIRGWALLCEQHGFDTFWIPDELVWESEETGAEAGWWECVAVAGAAAAVTSTIAIGSWVLSALHRNPALTVKAAETLDEISAGRFVFGLGAGHAGRQGAMFGFPPDRTVSRYEDALAIVVPLLRKGSADHAGPYHRAERVPNRPRGPQGPSMPLMLAGHGPRNIGLAVRHADIWSAFATSSSQPDAFDDMLALVDRTCEEQGRDPASLGRSIGVGVVLPGHESFFFGDSHPIGGTVEQIAETMLAYAERGVTSIELMVDGDAQEAIPVLAEAVAIVKAA